MEPKIIFEDDDILVLDKPAKFNKLDCGCRYRKVR